MPRRTDGTRRRGRPRRSDGEERIGILNSTLTRRQRNERRRKAEEFVRAELVEFYVPSHSRPNGFHRVKGPPYWSCDCEDFRYRTGDCQHAQAARMMLAIWIKNGGPWVPISI